MIDAKTSKEIKARIMRIVNANSVPAHTHSQSDITDLVTALAPTKTAYNAGIKSSGTYTPSPDDGVFQYAINGGAHTLAPPSASPGDSVSLIIQYTNSFGAGIITTSGFTKVSGDALTTTNGDDFLFFITVCNGFSLLNVTALQ
jgi:hypothetical protein